MSVAAIISRLREWHGKFPADAKMAAALFAAGAFIAMVYAATWGGTPQFWQNTTFMQGIMWNCGHGFENPMVSDIPGMDSFLNLQTDCFDCNAIPEGVRILPHDTRGMTFDEIDAYHPQPQFPGFLAWQHYHLYLVLAVTFCWWALGAVCWSALTPLCGMLYGASTAAAYGLFRLGMRRPLAVLFAVLLMISPLHLQMAPHVRDYAKAPFILSALFIMGYLIKFPVRGRNLLALTAAGGALAGLGIGFRTDLAVCVPAFLVVALVFLPGRLRATWAWRIAAAGMFTAAFCFSGYPILVEVFKESGHFAHVTLLGFLRYCDDRLGVGAAMYHLGDPYTDFYMANVVQSYMHRTHGVMPPTHVMMPEYHAATQQYLLAYLKVFPADVVFRAYASVLRILDEMHPNTHAPWPLGITNQFLQWCYQVRAAALDHLPLGGRYYAAAALLLIAAVNLRWALAAFFLLMFFGGYPAMQFNLRHAFHLEFLSLWSTGFLLQVAWNTGVHWMCRRRAVAEANGFHLSPAVKRVAIFGAAAAALIAVPLLALRPYQHAALKQVIDQVAEARLEPLPAATDAAPVGEVFYRFPGFARADLAPPDQAALPVLYAYMAIELQGAPAEIPVTFAYDADDREHFDYTRTVTAAISPGQNGPTRLYFPLYYSRSARFLGVRLPARFQDRVSGFYRVAGAEHIPLWLTLILPPDWESLPRHQSFTR